MRTKLRADRCCCSGWKARDVSGDCGAMNFGATLINPTTTRFRFWAPAPQSVALEVEGLEPVPMRRLDDARRIAARQEHGGDSAGRERREHGPVIAKVSISAEEAL